MAVNLSILFSGMIAADPGQGGATWAVLQYVLGLRELGHRVCFVEPIKRESLQPAGSSLADSRNAQYFRAVIAEFGLDRDAALLLEGTSDTVGLSYAELAAKAARADLLINVSGMLTDERLLAAAPVRAYLDLDPAFIQLWHAEHGIDMRFAAHNRFVTIGQAIGEPTCDVPTCDVDWIKTWQPVVLSHWPVGDTIEHEAFTTIANWRAYGSAQRNGIFYGQKAHSLREFISLPMRTDDKFLLALAIYAGDAKDLEALRANRWELIAPAAVADTPARYQQFIRGSRAELGIAKSGYVLSRCGWFSDRSVAYLASGRPVLAQDTGFTDFLSTGEGLLAFSNIEEALRGIETLRADYPRHCRAARALAEAHFDSRKVLPQLLERVGVA